jgi:hypothetical protein
MRKMRYLARSGRNNSAEERGKFKHSEEGNCSDICSDADDVGLRWGTVLVTGPLDPVKAVISDSLDSTSKSRRVLGL